MAHHCHHHHWQAVADKSSTTARKKAPLQYSTEWLLEQAKSGHGTGNAALIALTKRNKKKGKGWLRQLHNLHNGKKQLTVEEWRLVLGLHLALSSAADTRTTQLALAWGITRNTLNTKVKKAIDTGSLDVARKTRSDKGQTVFNSDEKRGSVYTERHCFSKIFRAKHKGETFDESEITIQYNRLSEDHPLEEGSKAASTIINCKQSAYLEAEAGHWLRHTNGSITWERLAQQMSGQGNHQIVSNKYMQ
jgi:hypothetical protein